MTAAPRAACRRAGPACKTPGDCSATLRPRGRSRNSGPCPGGKRLPGRRWARGRRGAPCRKALPGDRDRSRCPGGRIAKQGRQPWGDAVQSLRIAISGGPDRHSRQLQQTIERIVVGGRQRGIIMDPFQQPIIHSQVSQRRLRAPLQPRGHDDRHRLGRRARARTSRRPRPPPRADRCRRLEVTAPQPNNSNPIASTNHRLLRVKSTSLRIMASSSSPGVERHSLSIAFWRLIAFVTICWSGCNPDRISCILFGNCSPLTT